MSPAKRNITANTISKFLRIAFTLILIPVYIKYLGDEIYSDWILLFSLPALFEITNFGINQAVNNTFSIYHNRNYKESNLIIINGFYLTVIIGITIISIIFFLWESIGAYEFLNLSLVSSNNSKIILILLTIKIFSDMVKGILCSYFFAQNNHHINVYIDLLQYTIENIILITLVILGFNLVFISNAYIFPSLITCLLLILYNSYKFSLNLFSQFLSLRVIKILIKPSSSFSLLTISEYILNQGFIIFLKKYFNSQELIIFNSSKTLVNYLKTIQGLVASSVAPVFNVYFGKKQFDDLIKLYKKSNRLTVYISIFLSFGLACFASIIWQFWIGDSLEFNFTLMILLILVQVISSFWIIPSNLIVSINKHFQLSWIYLISSTIAVVIFYYYAANNLASFFIVPLFYLIHQISMLLYSKIWVNKFFKKLLKSTKTN